MGRKNRITYDSGFRKDTRRIEKQLAKSQTVATKTRGAIETENTSEVTVSVNDRLFVIELSIQDEELIRAIVNALRKHVKKGSTIRLRQAYVDSLSESTKVTTNLISESKQIDEWIKETNHFICSLRNEQ